MFPCHESSGPSGLEVEASGDAINVKDFTGKVEAGHDAALHRLEVHFTHVNASAGYEFFFERTFSCHRKNATRERVRQFFNGLVAAVGPVFQEEVGALQMPIP